MVKNLEDAIIILEDAIKIRNQERENPDSEAAFDTEESVIASLRQHGERHEETLRLKARYTRAARIIIHQTVDPKG